MALLHNLCRKILIMMLLAAAVFTGLALLSPVSALAADIISEDITDECIITCSDKDPVTKIVDGNYRTLYRYQSDVTIYISSPEPVQGLYMVWNLIPGEWTLNLDGTVSVCGSKGFIHEYVPASDAREIEITLPEGGAQLCDIYVFSEGRLPEWVQTWNGPYDTADLLVISTHSDDEEIFFGGIIPTYAGEYGLNVQVAYLTSHWREPIRSHELLCGLWTMGVTHYPIISEMDDLRAYDNAYPVECFVEYEVELLRRFKPAVAVVQDLKGEYGHQTHIIGSNAMLTAVEYAADAEKYPEIASEYGVWDLPKLYIHMYADEQLTMDWHVPLRSFGGRDAFEMALEGFACHESQHHLVFYPEEFGKGDCRLFGLYRSTVGSDTCADLMDNTGIISRRGLDSAMRGIKCADDTVPQEG